MILKISLQPLDRFFFGGENGFNEEGQDSRRSTYVLHSRYYPQQTGMLGLLRNQLLLQNGLLWDNTAQVTDKAGAKVLIGKHGFKVGYAGSYGVIEKISPVYLATADGNCCPPGPLDDVQIKSKDEHRQEILKEMIFTRKYGRPQLENYSEKSGLYSTVQHPVQGILPLEKAFAQAEQVGITKAARNTGNAVNKQDDESGYYYQTFLKASKPKAGQAAIQGYICYVQLAEEVIDQGIHYRLQKETDQLAGKKNIRPYSLRSSIVEFGGERGTFSMTVQDAGLTAIPSPVMNYRHTRLAAGEKAKRLVCLSPAFVDTEKLRQESLLVISQTLSFRFFRSEIDSTSQHQAISRNKQYAGGVQESELYQLLDRGTAVYFDPAKEQDIKTLFHYPDFQTIGYNQFIVL